MVDELKVTPGRGGNHHPLSVRAFISKDTLLTKLTKGIQLALRNRGEPRIYEGCFEKVLRDMGAEIVEWPGRGVQFPDYITREWGHSCGAIDLYAELNGKRIGLEVEESGWYRACESELLKLGWSDLDYRIVAWDVRQLGPIGKLASVEMLPFPNSVLVITQFGIVEVSSGS